MNGLKMYHRVYRMALPMFTSSDTFAARCRSFSHKTQRTAKNWHASTRINFRRQKQSSLWNCKYINTYADHDYSSSYTVGLRRTQ